MSLSIFKFNDIEVRTVIEEGKPWWVARDVCNVLAIANERDAISRLDRDERMAVGIADSATGADKAHMAVSESGLYSLILRSRKPEAKAFKKWVTSEVLPAIRTTGAYAVAPREALSEVDRLAGIVGQLLPALSVRIGEVTDRQQVLGERLGAVEERQRITDPIAIEKRMRFLQLVKGHLVTRTSGKPQAVTYTNYWRTLKDLIGINSFTNRAALTVPMMDTCVAYAREWCETRGVELPSVAEELIA